MLTITEFKNVFLRSLVAILKVEGFVVVRKDNKLTFYSKENEGVRGVLEVIYNIDGIGRAYAMYCNGESIISVICMAKEEIYDKILSVFKHYE